MIAIEWPHFLARPAHRPAMALTACNDMKMKGVVAWLSQQFEY